MGYAKVISGGELGRYTIELDYGSTTRTAILAALDVLIAQIVVKLAGVQVKITAADEKEAAQQVKVAQARAAYIEESQNLAPGSPAPQTTQFRLETLKLTELRAASAPLRLQKSALEFDLAGARRRRAYWDAFNPVETRDAWCTDYTTDRAAGSYVATVDVPGESALILLAPGARAWQVGDGILTARELMSPEQAFFNAAILPGWQKDKPTYRWGTITALDKEAALCSVTLFDAKSSAQRLPVNKTNTLTGVPITYMECNAAVFEVDDRVVVQFLGQDWDQPVVVGFLDNPRPCRGWAIAAAELIDGSVAGAKRLLVITFSSISSNARHDAEMAAASAIDLDFRFDKGAWTAPDTGPSAGPITDGTWVWDHSGFGVMRIDLVRPGFTPISGGAFAGLDGAPAHFRVIAWVNSGWASPQPYPLDTTLEVRLRLDGEVFANVAVKVGFEPFAVKCDRRPIESLALELPYVRFVEE